MTSSFFLLALIFSSLCAIDAYQAYTDGFYNTYLPGSDADPRHSPNTPFSVDTNRYSDGYTSSAYFDITSPHFPQYFAALANVSDRYLRYTKYAESAAEQGVGLYGDGDARVEDAKVKITSQTNYESLPAPQKVFPVYAAIKWNPSDFAIQEGEWYNVTVFGNQQGFSDQFWYDGGIRVNANGYESYFDSVSNCYVGMGRCRSHLKKKRRLLTANWMSLSCAVGQFVRPLVEIEPGKEETYRWLPLDESQLQGSIFNVGQSVEFRAVSSGQLICFANDAHSLYWNNAGFLSVTVRRVSWPPSSSTYYQELYLPACDSARVAYVNHGINTDAPGKIKCNPNGGGTGWTLSDIDSANAQYGIKVPSVLFQHNVTIQF